jgi:hypothetical protein
LALKPRLTAGLFFLAGEERVMKVRVVHANIRRRLSEHFLGCPALLRETERALFLRRYVKI